MNFERVELKVQNGELTVVLHVDEQQGESNSEFAQEFYFSAKEKTKDLRQSAIGFVKKHYPKLKAATIIVAAGTVILTSIPMNKAEAHDVDFNMSYLYFGSAQTMISQVDKAQGNLSLVSPSYFDLNADGSLKITSLYNSTFVQEMHNRGIDVVPFLSNHWDRTVGRAALANREQLSTQIADFIIKNNLDGINVDIENVSEVDRDSYTDLVRLLREKLPADKEVSVAVAANPNGWTKGWHGSYDYGELAKYSDYLMIMAYDESYEGGPEGPVASYGWVERSIKYALNKGVPADKIVLGLPFYGRFWKEGAATSTGGTGISNVKVDELLKKYGGTVDYDEVAQSPKATITIKEGDPVSTVSGKTLGPGTYHIWYENNESLEAKFDLIHKYNLKGAGSWSLGQESTSMWSEYRTWTTHDGQVQVAPVTPKPSEQVGQVLPTSTTTYIVKSGDTLWRVATYYNMSTTELKELNNLPTDVIYPGQVLKVKSPGTATTQETVVVNPPANTPGAISAPSSTTGMDYPILNSGSTGTAVTDLQSNLKKLGYYDGPVNGIYNTSTKYAVGDFQRKYDLTPDGIAGPATLSKLEEVLNNPTPVTAPASSTENVSQTYPTLKSGSTGAAVTKLQSTLKGLGYYDGPVNGIYNTSTKYAVGDFQRKYDLKPDGIAGPATLSKLDEVIDKSAPTAEPTSNTADKSYPTLNTGSSGSAVTELQTSLKKLGYYNGPINGIYNTSTKYAVGDFQRKYGFIANGTADSQTLAKLDQVMNGASIAPTTVNPTYTTLAPGSRGGGVENLQSKLKSLGYYNGPVNGIYNTSTKYAVGNFQREHGMIADGTANPTTQTKIDEVIGR
nr:peptidoglycan-binding protein [Lysinibacillus timonensis]